MAGRNTGSSGIYIPDHYEDIADQQNKGIGHKIKSLDVIILREPRSLVANAMSSPLCFDGKLIDSFSI